MGNFLKECNETKSESYTVQNVIVVSLFYFKFAQKRVDPAFKRASLEDVDGCLLVIHILVSITQ